MKVVVQKARIKCDIGNCRNQASYSIIPNNAGQGQYIHLCEGCLKELYNSLTTIVTPRAINNIVAKGESLAKQTIVPIEKLDKISCKCESISTKAVATKAKKKTKSRVSAKSKSKK